MQPMQCPTCREFYPVSEKFCDKDGASLSPTMIGEYVLEAPLGRGGMGEVWHGRHPQINKQVAIKFLHPQMARNEGTVKRFLHEARSVNEVRHRNLVDIFAFGQLATGQPYMVMELLQGKPLSEFLKLRGPLPLVEIIRLLGPMCGALHKAHEAGLVHRDLKPENLFVVLEDDTEPFVKILDFGLVKFAQEEGEGLTQSGAIFGTAEYMSPEQCERSRDVDRRTDIYALGAIVCAMLTGRTPFRERDDSVAAIIAKQLTMMPEPPSKLVEGRKISPEIDAVILRALSKNRADRQTTAMVLFEELKKAAAPHLAEVEELGSVKARYAGGATLPLMNTAEAGQMLAKNSSQSSIPPTVSLPGDNKPTKFLWLGLFGFVSLLSAGVYVFASATRTEQPTVQTHTSTIKDPAKSEPTSKSAVETQPTPKPTSIETSEQPKPKESAALTDKAANKTKNETTKAIIKDPKKGDKTNEPPTVTPPKEEYENYIDPVTGAVIRRKKNP